MTYDFGYEEEEEQIGERVIWSWERKENVEGELTYYEKGPQKRKD